MAIFNGFSEEKLEEILNGYFNGLFTTRDLPVDVYDASVERISQGLFGGFGGSLDDFEDLSGEKELLKFFDHNVQMFSAAKTFQEAEDITSALFDADGFKRSFSDFKKDAAKITAVYNETWLRTEFDTASNMGLSGRQWLDAERDKEIAPLLKYETVGDERVRPQHVNLDGIVRPVGSTFWNTHYPPNGWNCRCIVEQLFEGEEPITEINDLPPPDEIPPLFRMNPGKDKFIFNEAAHPYFTVNEADEQFKRQNFGLPVGPKPIAAPKSLTEPFKPDNFDSLMGKNVDMGDQFFPLLKTKTNLRVTKTAGSVHKATRVNGRYVQGNITINTKRHSTDVLKKSIIAHEFGHAIHWQNNWLVPPASNLDELTVHPEINKVFRKWEKKTGKISDKKKSEQILTNLRIKIDNVAFNEMVEKLAPKHPIRRAKFEREASEHWGKMIDTIGALTRNKAGSGHSKSYLNIHSGYGARAEFFAHSSENYFAGNPFFKEAFPEMYDDMKGMINTLIKESETNPSGPPIQGGF